MFRAKVLITLAEANRAGILIAPVYPGEAALLAARSPKDDWIFAGKAITSFSDEEEVELGTADNARCPPTSRR